MLIVCGHSTGTPDTVLCVRLHSHWHLEQCAAYLFTLHLNMRLFLVCRFPTKALCCVRFAEHSGGMVDTHCVPCLGVTSCPPPTWRYGPRKSML